jgi:multidrug resistance efflux pump
MALESGAEKVPDTFFDVRCHMNETGNRSPETLSERVRSLRLTEVSNAGASAGWWIPWAICLVLLCATAVLALEAFSPIDDEMVKKLAEERGLSVGKPEAKGSAWKFVLPGAPESAASEITLESKGYIVPFSLVQVSPKISATVMKLYIKEGMAVNKDFVLAELEEVEYQSDLDHAIQAKEGAAARLEALQKYRPKESTQAEAERDEAKSQNLQNKLSYVRAVELKKTGGIAPAEYEAAESAYLASDAREKRLQIAYEFMSKKGPRDALIDAAKADWNQAEADRVKAKWRKDNTKVLAPIKGIILTKKTEEGNIVNPAAFSNGLSASLCEMADLHDLEVDLSIAERDIAKLFKDQDCRIRAEAFPNRIYTGYISRIMPMGDRSKSSVPVRVKIQFPAVDAKGQPLPKDEQGEYLRPEMGAIVTFLNRKAK